MAASLVFGMAPLRAYWARTRPGDLGGRHGTGGDGFDPDVRELREP